MAKKEKEPHDDPESRETGGDKDDAKSKGRKEIRGREKEGDGTPEVNDEGGGKRKGKGVSENAAGRRDRLTGTMTFPSVYDKIDKRKDDSSIRGRSVTKEK